MSKKSIVIVQKRGGGEEEGEETGTCRYDRSRRFLFGALLPHCTIWPLSLHISTERRSNHFFHHHHHHPVSYLPGRFFFSCAHIHTATLYLPLLGRTYFYPIPLGPRPLTVLQPPPPLPRPPRLPRPTSGPASPRPSRSPPSAPPPVEVLSIVWRLDSSAEDYWLRRPT